MTLEGDICIPDLDLTISFYFVDHCSVVFFPSQARKAEVLVVKLPDSDECFESSSVL